MNGGFERGETDIANLSHLLDQASNWILPILIFAVVIWALSRRIPLYQTFVDGAREGLLTGLRIAPYLLAMLVAIGVFRASGSFQTLLALLKPLLDPLGIPGPIIPLGLMRPISGSGSLGLLADLLAEYGPDSRLGFCASIVQGSTETTFYVLTVYLGVVGIRRMGHIWLAGLLADCVAFLAAVILAGLFFRS